MSKFLILGASTVQLEVSHLISEMGLQPHFAGKELRGQLPDGAVFHKVDITDIDSLRLLLNDTDFAGIYSFGSDVAMPIVSRLAEEMDWPFFVSAQVVNDCNDKSRMRRQLGKSDFNLRSETVKSADEVTLYNAIGFPLIVKPVDGQGQRAVQKIYDVKSVKQAVDLAIAASRSGLAQIEEYADGPEFSINAYMRNGVVLLSTGSDRLVSEHYFGVVVGHILPSELPHLSEGMVRQIAIDVSDRMGIADGPMYIQAIMTALGPRVVEVAARFDGCHMWRLINLCGGPNLAEIALNDLVSHNYRRNDSWLEHDTPLNPGRLDFVLRPPGTPIKMTDQDIADADILYFQEGDITPEVNGRLEKVGYSMRSDSR